MESNSQLYLILGKLGGTIIGSLTTILITLINKRSEEKNHFHRLAMVAATESWGKCLDHVNLQGHGWVDSLDTFIRVNHRYFRLLFGKNSAKVQAVSLFEVDR